MAHRTCAFAVAALLAGVVGCGGSEDRSGTSSGAPIAGSASAPIVLVPGFWLGAWAWDDVAARLRADAYDVTALTLPGLESKDSDRSSITLSDHVRAICRAVEAAKRPVVLVVHSGAGASGYAASDLCFKAIAAMVYVDSGPATAPFDASFQGVEEPLPSPAELAATENLDGLTKAQLQTFRRRAVPEPGGVLRGAPKLMHEARLDIPTTAICTASPCETYKTAAAAGSPFYGGFAEIHRVTWVELPTSHWPMWSRPKRLAEVIGNVARHASHS